MELSKEEKKFNQLYNVLSKDERSLILFFEYTAVDQWGWIKDMRCMNDIDKDIAKKWNESGFILFKRASRHSHTKDGNEPDATQIQLTYVVKLSENAWKLAHKLRKEKALRNIPEPL